MRGRCSTQHNALKGHQAVAGGNAPGRIADPPTDPARVADTGQGGKALLRQRFFFDPFRVGGGGRRVSGGVAPGY